MNQRSRAQQATTVRQSTFAYGTIVQNSSSRRRLKIALAVAALCVASACAEPLPTGLAEQGDQATRPQADARRSIPCTATVSTGEVKCGASAMPGGLSSVIFGGQNLYVKLTSSNVSYDAGSELFTFDVTVQNLMNEAIGTPDGVLPDPDGIQVFIHQAPIATDGFGAITVENEAGIGTFTNTNQEYFTYADILERDEVSASQQWRFKVPATVNTFSFSVFLETDIQYLLVINEVMANPVGLVSEEQPREWFELYNAGTLAVQLQGLVIADSAASGRRPYHVISASLSIAAGTYVGIGANTNTTTNAGATIDYAYGTALALANSLDAIKIARVHGTDTLTIDRTQYANAAVSAQEGVSRELTNPALDNANMDGSNWASAAVTAVYGAGGRGTPKAQNSTFTPEPPPGDGALASKRRPTLLPRGRPFDW